MTSEIVHPQYFTIAGKRAVVLGATEYARLATQADVWEPPMPDIDESGNIPAMEAMAVSLARDILRERRRLGLSQADLARLAGIRVETLNRLERAESRPNVAALDKIEAALKAAKEKHRRLRSAK
jgi:ribosome-binding protein aMBF1 (putative translation factor)